MTNHHLLEAIGHIDPQLIEDAAPGAHRSKKASQTWVKWGAMAACFCLLIAGVFAAFQIGLFDNIELGDNDPEIIPGSDGDTDSGADNEEYHHFFSIANGALYLEIYDSYTIPGEADVITVYLTECQGVSQVYFRSSDKIDGQIIRRIESTDGKQIATNDNGVFTLDFLEKQDFVCLNLYFDAGTFKKSAELNGNAAGNEEVDVDYDPNAPVDEDVPDDYTSSTSAMPATVYFECSALDPNFGYDEIRFASVLSAISNEPKVNIVGSTDNLEEAVNAIGLQALLVFEEYSPRNISYSKTNGMSQLVYSYGLNAVVTVKAYEYYKADYTLDTFVGSTNLVDYLLYPFNTRSELENGLEYDIYTCYKNDEEFRSEIAVLHYTDDGNSIFFVVEFDLSGENIHHEVKYLMQQMKLVD